MGRIFSEASIAYLSGLFDGDGAIMAFIERHKEKKFGFRVRVAIKVTQRNSEILYWIKREFGLGNVVKNRTAYEWIIRNQKEILIMLFQLKKYLKIKAKQAEIAIDILQINVLSYKDLLKVAKLADSLSEFNVRSKGRRKNFLTKIKENVPRND